VAKVTMPQLGESVAEGTIGKWLKQPGDTVAKYEPLLEVITDKVNAEVPSPFAGVLKEILVEEGATVPNNAEIAVIETADEGGAAAATAPVAIHRRIRAGRSGTCGAAGRSMGTTFGGKEGPIPAGDRSRPTSRMNASVRSLSAGSGAASMTRRARTAVRRMAASCSWHDGQPARWPATAAASAVSPAINRSSPSGSAAAISMRSSASA